jgi:serine/threonine protein kinase
VSDVPSSAVAADLEDDVTEFAFADDPFDADDLTNFHFGSPAAPVPISLGPTSATPTSTAPTITTPSTSMPRYRLGELIGRGGMCEVLTVRDRLAGAGAPDLVAKRLRPEFRANPAAVATLEAQAALQARLDHPGVARFVDFVGEGGEALLIMERVPGGSLGRLLRETGGRGPGPDRVAALLHSMAEALAHAHRQDIAHGDLKPGNILVGADGRAKLVDFLPPAAPGTVALTPAYASAARAGGAAPTPADDVFSFAVIAYELLAGRHPFGRGAAAEALQTPPAPKGIRARQWRALRRGLSARAEERPADIVDFAAELAPKTGTRRPLIWALAALALAGATILLILLLR